MTRIQWLALNPLRQWRHRNSPSLSLGACARLLGVTPPCCLYWERGDRKPTLESLQSLKYHCGITFDEWDRWWRMKDECLEEK